MCGGIPKISDFVPAPGVVIRRIFGWSVPRALANLLNDASMVLRLAYKGETGLAGVQNLPGVNIMITAEQIGSSRSWQIEFSATNTISRDGIPDGGMIASLSQFSDAVRTANETLNRISPRSADDGGNWDLMGDLATHFERITWATRLGARGNDGKPHGKVIMLTADIKPGSGL